MKPVNFYDEKKPQWSTILRADVILHNVKNFQNVSEPELVVAAQRSSEQRINRRNESFLWAFECQFVQTLEFKVSDINQKKNFNRRLYEKRKAYSFRSHPLKL